MCDACLRKLRRLKARTRSRWSYDPLTDAVVWADEEARLCVECERTYRVVLNVRTQQLMGESPSPEFVVMYEQFRRDLPEWVGFRRRALTRAQELAARRTPPMPARNEILD